MRMVSRRAQWMVGMILGVFAISAGLAQQPPQSPQQKPPDGAQQKPPAAGGKPANPGAFSRPPALPFPTSPREIELVGTTVRVVPVAGELANPWSIAFLPNGDMLVTERPGRLRIVRNGKLDPEPIAGVPEVFALQQGGLLEVLPHPQFAQNQFVYLTYSKPGPDQKTATTALARGRFDGKALVDMKDIFVADNMNTGGIHFGSKLAFDRDGLLYMTIGERNDRHRAQDPSNHGGTLVRLHDDGTVPKDNPFVGRDGYKPEIYSYGHRNAQGLAIHPETGAVWLTEHGPQGGDELNLVLPAKNYGWPVVTHGREYAGPIISEETSKEGMEEPFLVWVPSIGTSGLIIYTGDAFPFWKGQFFAGGLAGLRLDRIGISEKGLLGRDTIHLQHRVRDVRQGPDGFIYIAVDSNPGGVLRLEPGKPMN
jgi:aldose sugar dehydrogenase